MRLMWPSTLPELHRRVSPAGDGVLVGAQAGDERLKRGFAAGGCGGHPVLKVAAAAFSHQSGKSPDVLGDGGQFRARGKDGVEAGLSSAGRVPGLVMIQISITSNVLLAIGPPSRRRGNHPDFPMTRSTPTRTP
jgi:hypothetical protein